VLAAGRESIYCKRSEAGMPSVSGQHFSRKPHVAQILGTNVYNHSFKNLHAENFDPRSGTLFPVCGKVK